MNSDEYDFPTESREYVNEKTGERIVQYGRVTAVFPSITATDCKVSIGNIAPTAAEINFLDGMVCLAQNDTHHERSPLWIAADIHEALNCRTVKEVRQHAEKVAQKWAYFKLQLAMKRRQP